MMGVVGMGQDCGWLFSWVTEVGMYLELELYRLTPIKVPNFSRIGDSMCWCSFFLWFLGL